MGSASKLGSYGSESALCFQVLLGYHRGLMLGAGGEQNPSLTDTDKESHMCLPLDAR